MVLKREKYPQIGELIVARAETVEKMYVYVRLEDYAGSGFQDRARGMIHISELANRWIRNISNYVKMNQRVVLKVLRVNPEKGHIDLSLRRVNSEQKAATLNEWKYEIKADNLFRILAKSIEITIEEVYAKIGFPLIDAYGDIHTAFEEIKEKGLTEIDFLEISENWKNEVFQLIDQNVQLTQVEVEGIFEIVVYEGNGIETIKKAIKKAKAIKKGKLSDFNFHYIGAPVYSVKIVADNYPAAEKNLKKIIKSIETSISSVNGQVEFYRT